ncbi:MAG TPA: hypothetical protein PK432_01090, partial [Candidatus Dojkabacteria bacterium]|nr:hypothetical protein [Candidatus Dojkabacteria bacterium]
FYENTITNILKKQGYNPVLITDEYGNTWNEVTIDENRDNQNIVFQKTPKESTSKPDRFHTTDLGTTVSKFMQSLERDQRKILREMIRNGEIKFKCS